MSEGRVAVVALGGNSITRESEEDNIPQQFKNTRRSLGGVIDLIKKGYRLAITHGNGPQIGNALIRVEETRHLVPFLPLGIIVADLQGGMGYMIAQSLQNRLHLEGIKRQVTTVLTQVIVKKNDPSMKNPTKFVGPTINVEEIYKVRNERGWIIKKDPGRGYRRVVPSPAPLEIVEKKTIKSMIARGEIPICAGGGGIPVYVKKDGTYEGVDAVIDKDLASAILARDIGADELYIMTAVEKVALNYRQTNEIQLDEISIRDAKKYYDEGHFPNGSMGPKIQAAINFIETGGKSVTISSIGKMKHAIMGKTGTRIVK